MKNKNICKIVTSATSDKLEVHNFIYETNPEVMRKEIMLTHNRAILVKQGKGKFMFDGKPFLFSAGTLVFGFENESFESSVSDDCIYMYIDFNGTRASVLFRRFGISATNRIFSRFDGIVPLWQDSLSRASEENTDLAAESVLLYVFSRFSDVGQKQNSFISEIIEITEDEFANSDLSVVMLANRLSYNPKYISHIFKEKMGVTYTEYLRNVRIKYAVTLFDHGIDSVKNVAFLSGFTDPLYFSTVFKKVVGKSPSEYMKK